MMRKCEVSIIIVNFNTKALLRNCLQSIFDKTKCIDYEVIVSDNGSTDDSIEMLQKEFPQVILIENNANLGFGSANNRGLDVANGECVLFLNSDTLFLNNVLKLFYEYWKFNEGKSISALGCNLVDADGLTVESYGIFPSSKKLLKNMAHHVAAFYAKNIMKVFGIDISKCRPKPAYKVFVGDVDYVTGADLFMANTDDARFDEKFFLYYEETDLQLRLRKKNTRSVIIDEPKIMHLIRGGRAKFDDVVHYGSFSIVQSEISKVRYSKKHLSVAVAFLLKMMITIQWLSPFIFKNTRKYFKSLWMV